jgi:hypothetical protein
MLNALLWPVFVVVIASGVFVVGAFVVVFLYELLHDVDDRLAAAHSRFLHFLHTLVHPHEWHMPGRHAR